MPRLRLTLLSMAKKMWPKVTAYALLGVGSALAAAAFKGYISEELSRVVDRNTANNILTILASSMLAVTTFSLSTMVSAYSAATSNVTPRATRLITEDKTTQNVLSTFLGSFLFSLVGIIALNMGVYEGGGRFILFVVTLGVIVLIVITLIRWIERLTSLGRVSETSRLVEVAAAKAMAARARKPAFGCSRLVRPPAPVPPAWVVKATQSGYVQFFDAERLAKVAAENDFDIFVTAMPGKFVGKGDALALPAGELPEGGRVEAQKCFTIGDERVFEQDPRFGVCVLAEIACRAASAAINDHGTLIDVIGRLGRVLELYATELRQEDDVEFKRLWVPELSPDDLFEDAFSSLARDAAAAFGVQVRLQKTLVRLGSLGRDYLESARKYSNLALRYAEDKLLLDEEKEALASIARRLDG